MAVVLSHQGAWGSARGERMRRRTAEAGELPEQVNGMLQRF